MRALAEPFQRVIGKLDLYRVVLFRVRDKESGLHRHLREAYRHPATDADSTNQPHVGLVIGGRCRVFQCRLQSHGPTLRHACENNIGLAPPCALIESLAHGMASTVN